MSVEAHDHLGAERSDAGVDRGGDASSRVQPACAPESAGAPAANAPRPPPIRPSIHRPRRRRRPARRSCATSASRTSPIQSASLRQGITTPMDGMRSARGQRPMSRSADHTSWPPLDAGRVGAPTPHGRRGDCAEDDARPETHGVQDDRRGEGGRLRHPPGRERHDREVVEHADVARHRDDGRADLKNRQQDQRGDCRHRKIKCAEDQEVRGCRADENDPGQGHEHTQAAPARDHGPAAPDVGLLRFDPVRQPRPARGCGRGASAAPPASTTRPAAPPRSWYAEQQRRRHGPR